VEEFIGVLGQDLRSGCPIISFDFEDEQFREVPKPDCGGLERPNIDLVDLGGCLAAVSIKLCNLRFGL
jgi:hypothetical protein